MLRGKTGRKVVLALALAAGGCASRRDDTVRPTESAPATPPVATAPAEEAAPPAGTPATATVECDMKVPARVTLGERVEVEFTLHNPTKERLYVLDWNTPMEQDLRGDIFQVVRDGAELPYFGRVVRRAPPAGSAYVSLLPGASSTTRMGIAHEYRMQQPGTYHITFRGTLLDVTTDAAQVPSSMDRFQPMAVTCPTVVTTLVAK